MNREVSANEDAGRIGATYLRRPRESGPGEVVARVDVPPINHELLDRSYRGV
jgi:hypothetical protein